MSIAKEQMMFIVYVKNQEKSRIFYEQVLGFPPALDVPGMTEFQLAEHVHFGIMPEAGIMRLLENKIPDPAQANGVPRCELYLYVDDPDEYYRRLVHAGGTGISRTEHRNWGDDVAYGSDPDGNILGFAKKFQA